MADSSNPASVRVYDLATGTQLDHVESITLDRIEPGIPIRAEVRQRVGGWLDITADGTVMRVFLCHRCGEELERECGAVEEAGP